MEGMRSFVTLAWLAPLALLGGGPAACKKASEESSAAPAVEVERKPYLARRAAHETELRMRGPSPGKWQAIEPPAGVMKVTYPSGDLTLTAWYASPYGGGNHSSPALVYFHGDFAFGPDDFEVIRPFLDVGFVVMTPMLRGENGNPGDFELLWGEVDDARAAVTWLAQQPAVDRNRIFAFGHSIGGGVVAMLSLYPELPLRATGSCGGIYMPETFARWAESERNAELVRFDAHDSDEIELRVLGPNLQWMVHRHVAYVGEQDPWFIDNAGALEAQAWALGKPFERVIVPGDHMESLGPALAAFRAVALSSSY
ncbi:MAG: prolyl oligopeptidase family serine peptidase [Myxococcales bacterium]|nr:prolyl oligopeptidase family serine peptidase [Myxococcales bacterium]